MGKMKLHQLWSQPRKQLRKQIRKQLRQQLQQQLQQQRYDDVTHLGMDTISIPTGQVLVQLGQLADIGRQLLIRDQS